MSPTRNSKAETRAPLSRERVLTAAMKLADESGIEALSMRKLAQALGVEAMSLYNHVDNKDDVLDGIVDIVISQIDLPEVGKDWRSAMRQRATSAYSTMLRHPWASLLIVSRINVGPAMLRYVDATIGCLREAGFSFEQADRAWNFIDSHIYGFALQQQHFPIEPSDYSSAAEAFLPMLPVDRYPYLHALSRQVIDGHHDGVQDFEFGLELILDGLERIRTQRPKGSGR